MMNTRMQPKEYVFDMATLRHTVTRTNLTSMVVSVDDLRLIEQLRSGNEAAFVSLIDRYHSTMLRLAMIYVKVWAVAEEVVQETWMAVLEGLKHFEGRSSLKTWMFRILTNRAKTRAQCEGRSVPFSSLADLDMDDSESTIDADRFLPTDHQWHGHWVSFPSNWQEIPEDHMLSRETRVCVDRAIEALTPSQREIIIMRDVEGWTAEETCTFLSISEGNQRVLLHRARSKVRTVLERYFEEE